MSKSIQHGKSPFVSNGTTLIAEAEFYDFAPQSCVCFKCFNNDFQQGRTYMRVWDNRLEMNFPWAPFMCCTSRDICVTDSITTWYFDRKPFRSGYCLYCIPMTCCGPPVIFSRKPMCCCIDMSNCYGQIILTTPHSCCGLKTFCCFGTPCYVSGALPLTNGLKDADVFLSKLKGAVDTYRVNNNLPEKEMAVFTIVNDNIGATGATNKVAASS